MNVIVNGSDVIVIVVIETKVTVDIVVSMGDNEKEVITNSCKSISAKTE